MMIRFFILSLVATVPVYALVDYSEGNDTTAIRTPQQIVNKAPARRQTTPSRGSKFFYLGMNYDSLETKGLNESGKIERMNLQGHIKTRAGVFIDFSYWQAKSGAADLAPEEKGFQNGNPVVKLGVNWLSFGGGTSAATIDILGGVSVAQNNSDFAASRNDKIFGVRTNKRIDNFILGIGMELIFTGSPDDEDETKIGNIRKIHAGVGWMVSSDIRFTLEAQAHKVSAAESTEESVSVLDESLSFSSLSPKLTLTISPAVELEMGASFQTRQTSAAQSIIPAKLLDYSGSYGNSIFVGLSTSI